MTDVALAHAYLCLRDVDANGLPVLPALGAAWTATAEADGWYSVRRNDSQILVAAWKANVVSAPSYMWVLFGPQATLEALAQIEPQCMPASELWALAKGGNAQAIAAARRWPVWRFTGAERIGGALVAVTAAVRRLIYEGQQMPSPATAFPWRFSASGAIVATDAEARYRVDGPIGSLKPALHLTMSGYALHALAEDEPVRT